MRTRRAIAVAAGILFAAAVGIAFLAIGNRSNAPGEVKASVVLSTFPSSGASDSAVQAAAQDVIAFRKLFLQGFSDGQRPTALQIDTVRHAAARLRAGLEAFSAMDQERIQAVASQADSAMQDAFVQSALHFAALAAGDPSMMAFYQELNTTLKP